jgi:IclR family KDG regulon transcriptional repressor
MNTLLNQTANKHFMERQMPEENDYRIAILDVTLDLMETLLASGRPMGASEVARAVGITRTRAFRILKSLHARGYVEFDTETEGYRLGLKLLEMGEGVREQLDLRRVAAPFLKELARKTGDVAHMLVRRGDVAVCIERYQGSHSLQGAAPIGMPLPLHVGASPKLLLAYLEKPEREALIATLHLEPLTPNTITDRDTLRRHLKEIRAQGYSIDQEDMEIGINAVGAPVRGHTGQVVAGVTVTTPVARWSDARKQTLIDLAIETAEAISAKLGYSGIPGPLDE